MFHRSTLLFIANCLFDRVSRGKIKTQTLLENGTKKVPVGTLERKTRFELATLALARRCSTTEPLPHRCCTTKEYDTASEKKCQLFCSIILVRSCSVNVYFLLQKWHTTSAPWSSSFMAIISSTFKLIRASRTFSLLQSQR